MGARSNTHIAIWLGVVALAVFLALQLANPRITNPPVTAELAAPRR